MYLANKVHSKPLATQWLFCYTLFMNDKDIIPQNPLENIAEIVRKQFREQAMNNMASDRPARKSVPTEIEIPSLPRDDRMQSKRRVRNEIEKTISKYDMTESSEGSVAAPQEDEMQNESDLENEGTIYADMADGTPGESPLSPEEAALQLALAVRKGHEKGKPDIDWHLVKSLYIYGGWTYERIANECNIAFSLVRLNGRKGRWPEAREAYRAEQAQKIQERLALEEDRLRDWQIIKRRQAGIDGLNWVVKALSNLRDDASPESIAKLAGLVDRMLSSVTGLSPVEGVPGAVNVSVQNNNVSNAPAFPPNSPQARLAAVWEKKTGENEMEHTRRLALTIRDLYMECDRAGLYDDMKRDPDNQRQLKLINRLGISEEEMPLVILEQ